MNDTNSDRSLPPALLWTALGLAGGYALYSLLQRTRQMKLRGQVALITGSSRGIGLALAHELARQGCHIVLCARSTQELAEAKRAVEQYGTEVLALPCDLRDGKQVRSMVAEATNHFGRIDLLVNNAGTIGVGPAIQMDLDDYRQAMDLIFYGTVQATYAVLPQMMNRGEGAIVNVTSVGGKVAMPHLLPYCCAKFAATAFSEGLHAEVAQHGIHVLTVVPGLVQNASFVNAEFKGKLEEEALWFAGGQMGMMAVATEDLAAEVVTALKNRRAELISPAPASVAARLNDVFPALSARALELIAQYYLPQPGGSDEAVRGEDIFEQTDDPRLRDIGRRGYAAGAPWNEPVPGGA